MVLVGLSECQSESIKWARVGHLKECIIIKCHAVPHSVPHSSPFPHSVPHSMFQSFTGLFVAFWKFHTYSTNLNTQGHKSH